MTRVAYLANRLPSAVEPYVTDEIAELRRRGIDVVACSIWRGEEGAEPVLRALGWSPFLALRALWLCWQRGPALAPFLHRITQRGAESLGCRLRAVVHTWLGACLAIRLRHRGVVHIHVHHGYFAAWIAMIAARLLGISYSVTLHGSDLLLGAAYLETKVANCRFCFTISEYNRAFLRRTYPQIPAEKILLQRMGVRIPPLAQSSSVRQQARPLQLLSVGRLHRVKNHAFLICSCAKLRDLSVDFHCSIAGAGPERNRLQRMIREFGLGQHVELLGHRGRGELGDLYRQADLVVLTSTSEGIPLTLMEAMSYGRCVLAPAITGIPELVIDGQTGLLYEAGSLEDFVDAVQLVHEAQAGLDRLREAARQHVMLHFNRAENLKRFGEWFAQYFAAEEEMLHASPVLQ